MIILRRRFYTEIPEGATPTTPQPSPAQPQVQQKKPGFWENYKTYVKSELKDPVSWFAPGPISTIHSINKWNKINSGQSIQ